MRPLFYILAGDGQTPVGCDALTANEWLTADPACRIVGLNRRGSVTVSTVFLCLDHSMRMRGPPVLWETMIFGPPLEHWQRRYTSWQDAKAGHQRALDVVTSIVRTGNVSHIEKLRR